MSVKSGSSTLTAGERADDHDATLHRRGREIDLHVVAADQLDGDVSFTAGRDDRLRQRGRVEGRGGEHTVIEPEPARLVELRLGARGAGDRAAERLGQLDDRGADARSDRVDEHVLARLQPGPGAHRVVRGDEDLRDPAGLDQVQVVGDRARSCSRGRPAPRPARRHRRCRTPGRRPRACSSLAERGDLARELHAGDVRRRRPAARGRSRPSGRGRPGSARRRAPARAPRRGPGPASGRSSIVIDPSPGNTTARIIPGRSGFRTACPLQPPLASSGRTRGDPDGGG